VISFPVPYAITAAHETERVGRSSRRARSTPTRALAQPELLLITSRACNLYSREALRLLGLEDRVGLLKLGTTWPLPPKLLRKYLSLTDRS